MSTDLSQTLLGRSVEAQPSYSAELLMPIARAGNRANLGIAAQLPFVGCDRWTGYELSWLEPGGKPRVAVLRCVVPASSPQLIESKSFKLYLNSYARERFDSLDAVHARLERDLRAAAQAPVAVELLEPCAWPMLQPQALPGICIDSLAVVVDASPRVRPEELRAGVGAAIEERLHSHLLKSNCPVTGQPDWGSILIEYRGAPIEHTGLLRYLLSFREVCEFHEHCVERVFMDLHALCAPQWLSVEARYTRRGGLDINPYRASAGPAVIADRRQWRQ